MIVTCTDCNATLNDEFQTTICPHERFLSPQAAEYKDAAMKILGKDVVFNHMSMEHPGWRVSSINHIGLVTLDGMAGEFAPYLFKVKE